MLIWVGPRENGMFFEETFPDRLWLGSPYACSPGRWRTAKQCRSVSFHQFSCLFQRVKAMAGHLSALQHPCQVEECLCPQTALRRQMSTKTSSNQGGDVPARFWWKKVPGFTVVSFVISADPDLNFSLSTVSWTVHPRRYRNR